jgi:hypothetical protein
MTLVVTNIRPLSQASPLNVHLAHELSGLCTYTGFSWLRSQLPTSPKCSKTLVNSAKNYWTPVLHAQAITARQNMVPEPCFLVKQAVPIAASLSLILMTTQSAPLVAATMDLPNQAAPGKSSEESTSQNCDPWIQTPNGVVYACDDASHSAGSDEPTGFTDTTAESQPVPEAPTVSQQLAEPVNTPQAVAAPEPVNTPQAVSAPEPVNTPQAVSAPEPVNTPQAVSAPEPVNTLQTVAVPEPVISVQQEASALPQIVKPEVVISSEPVQKPQPEVVVSPPQEAPPARVQPPVKQEIVATHPQTQEAKDELKALIASLELDIAENAKTYGTAPSMPSSSVVVAHEAPQAQPAVNVQPKPSTMMSDQAIAHHVMASETPIGNTSKVQKPPVQPAMTALPKTSPQENLVPISFSPEKAEPVVSEQPAPQPEIVEKPVETISSQPITPEPVVSSVRSSALTNIVTTPRFTPLQVVSTTVPQTPNNVCPVNPPIQSEQLAPATNATVHQAGEEVAAVNLPEAPCPPLQKTTNIVVNSTKQSRQSGFVEVANGPTSLYEEKSRSQSEEWPHHPGGYVARHVVSFLRFIFGVPRS